MVNCETGLENLCLDDIDGAWWGVLVELVVLLYAFVGVAIVADSHLVPSLETLCVRWNVPEDVAGASFMAFGSAAPEITINAISTVKAVLGGRLGGGGGPDASHRGRDDAALGVGAILGSGMIAFTAIPGFCGLFAGATLELKRRPLARDLGAYVLRLSGVENRPSKPRTSRAGPRRTEPRMHSSGASATRAARCSGSPPPSATG